MQALIKAAQIGKSGQKAQHVNEIVMPGMQRNHLFRRKVCVRGDGIHIQRKLFVIAHRNLDDPLDALFGGGEVAKLAAYSLAQLIYANDERVVDHHERAECGHQLTHAGNRICFKRLRSASDYPVRFRGNGVTKNKIYGRISGDGNAELSHRLPLLLVADVGSI